MKVPLDWLKEFVDIDRYPLAQLAEKMTICGLEVDHFDATHLEVSQTPDLGYTRSIVGVARFLKQIFDVSITLPKIGYTSKSSLPPLHVAIDAHTQPLVPQYHARRIEGIRNGASPEWMQNRLKLCSIQPKNLVVDVTNYVQIALGQPMHAFDLDRIGSDISIQMNPHGQDFAALNDQNYPVPAKALCIFSDNKMIAVAGVIGSKNSSVDESTTNIILESAQFSSRSIRKTAKGLKLSTPSSQRFENQIDPEMTQMALNYATDLLLQYGGASVTAQVHITSSLAEKKAILELNKVESLLGITTSIDELVQVMEKIDCVICSKTDEKLEVRVPYYRTDLENAIDLTEEVIKILGFERLIEKEAFIPLSAQKSDDIVEFKRMLRNKLLQQGLTEIMTPSLINKEHLLDPSSSIEVKNALSDRSILRTSLIYGALESALFNQNHGNTSIEAFEIGTVYLKNGDAFDEQSCLAVVLENDASDFFDLKGRFETVFEQLHLSDWVILPSQLKQFHPHRQACIEIQGEVLGHIGELHPLLLKKFGIKKRVYFGEILLSTLMQKTKKAFHIQPIPIYPAIERDTTFIVNKSISYAFLSRLIEANRPELLTSYSLKSIYDPKADEPTHNVTFHWVFRSDERSLTQDEVEKSMQKFVTNLQTQINS
jgi:phenylalanyl-tRNA synthetase beta chain